MTNSNQTQARQAHEFKTDMDIQIHLMNQHAWMDLYDKHSGAYGTGLKASELLAIHRELHQLQALDEASRA